MKTITSLLLFFLIFSSCTKPENTENTTKNLLEFVDLRIGVIDDRGSNCVIGPQLPFGSINPSPQTRNGSHDGYDPNEKIRGFGQLHVSGTGWGKYGQFLVSPQLGLAMGKEDHDSEKSNEIAQANYYAVTLDRYQIRAELSPTHNAVIYRFTFPESNEASVLIDVSHSLVVDIASMVGGSVSDCFAEFDGENNTMVKGGGTFEGGFGGGAYPLYFAAEFNKEPSQSGAWLNEKIMNNTMQVKQKQPSDHIGLFLSFNTEKNEEVLMKLAISFKSADQAASYLNKEIPAWDFEAVKVAGEEKWNDELNKIIIEDATEEQLTIFYTSLYHSMLEPRDRTGDNRFWEDGAPFWDDQYAVWDTWRTMYPLMVLLRPDMVADNISSFIDRFENNGMVRDAFIAGIDMYAEQGGNNVDNIIVDAMVKGLEGFDYERAYALLKYNADNERNGWQGFNPPEKLVNTKYKEQGWIPSGIMACSYTLEYAYNDFCIARAARILNKEEDHKNYLARSKKWINLWNEDMQSGGFSGFICPKDDKGNWVEIDAETDWYSWKLHFYESNSWTYSFFMPHDFLKVIELSGGPETFSKKLDYALNKKLISTSNEPSFLTVRSFNYSGRADLTSEWVRKTMNAGYDLEGYPGNDDSGAMSSWYIFSALGFFPNAGQDQYFLNSPLHKKATITLANGKKIEISAPNASEKNIYIKSCKLNGVELQTPFIKHSDIANGAKLDFDLVNTPIVF
ncbi:MAG: GH92 family glycosyl hydrolase [Bacteroidales bacterium]|nr:GH92 family glycosyl hydrolase [Bacteroidales bacterium]